MTISWRRGEAEGLTGQFEATLTVEKGFEVVG